MQQTSTKEVQDKTRIGRFGLVSLFNGLSTSVGYLMLLFKVILLEEQ